MKGTILDTIMRGLVFGALAWFGLRGVLPEAGPLLMLISSGVVLIVGYAVGSYLYRCTYRCDSICDPKLCRVM